MSRSEEEMADELSQRLAVSEMLIILDDVLSPSIVRSCFTLGPHLLVTAAGTGLFNKLRSAITSSGIRTYEMHPLPMQAAQTLLQTHFDFSVCPPSSAASAKRYASAAAASWGALASLQRVMFEHLTLCKACKVFPSAGCTTQMLTFVDCLVFLAVVVACAYHAHPCW
jgi:hypothetical protein